MSARRQWPDSTLTRVPYWIYQDEENYRAELRNIFAGPVWSFACLESDVPRPGDYRTTFAGEMPLIVVRGEDGLIRAFENRCAHRGALIALDDEGSTGKRFQCVYHAWSYDLEGNLVGIAFEKGSHGKGDECAAMHGDSRRRPEDTDPGDVGVERRRRARLQRRSRRSTPTSPQMVSGTLRESLRASRRTHRPCHAIPSRRRRRRGCPRGRSSTW